MFHRQQTSNSFAGSGALQAGGTLNQSRALRLSLVFCLLVSLASLCYYAVTALPQARLLSAAPWRSLPQQLMGAIAPRGDAVATRADAGATRGANAQVPSAPLVVADGAKGAIITYGDRLKITFFESLGVPLDEQRRASDHVVATVFPRMDLSAEYAVDEGGNVNIPKLGQFATAGRTIPTCSPSWPRPSARDGQTERCACRNRRAPADLRPGRGAQRRDLQASRRA